MNKDETLKTFEAEAIRLASLVASLSPAVVDQLYQKVSGDQPDVEKTVQLLAMRASETFLARKKQIPQHTLDAAFATARINIEARRELSVDVQKSALETSSTSVTKFYRFDDKYVELLRCGDRDTQNHFVAYFGKLLRIMLLRRKLPMHVINDLQQETFLRVLVAVRTGDVRQPERLGAYVISVCKNILSEHYRLLAREQNRDLDVADGPDKAADLEARIIADENSRRVRATINRLSERDRAVLQAMMQGRDKDEVCHELGIARGYLSVLMHSARVAFKVRWNER